jgi:hypothetical protein
MAKLEFFLVAQSCAIDSHTNRMSIFDVLEDVSVSQFPACVPSIVAVASWNADPGDSEHDFQASLVIHGPDGSSPERFDVNFTLRERRARTILRLELFPIEQPGTLRFEILLNGEHRADHIITVSRKDSAQTAP